MSDDERAIRDLVKTWMEATRAGDAATVLDLMTDDAVFMAPGQEPFGREAFAKASAAQQDMRIEGGSDIRELHIFGAWAFLRAYIDLTVTPRGGTPVRRSGWTLTLLRKGDDGRWRLARDANLLTVTS
jgi:uncharacterized protein (TIGR02246 family)